MRTIFYILLLFQLPICFTGCESFLSEPSKQVTEDYTGQIDTIFDIDGNAYKTVGIGSQIWTAQNLKTTKLNDSTIIPQVKDNTDWNFDNTPAYCWYNNDSITFSKLYGPLYNFHAVSSGLLCPIGWHVPNEAEWRTLTKFLGGTDVAGGKLKDYYSAYWSDPNNCFANNYGFAAFPGGRRYHFKGEFKDIKDRGYWWTSTGGDDFFAYSRSIYVDHDDTNLNLFDANKRDGFSIRCIKD
jgi:uncharacterized protein (TIGR02145 family)